MKKFFMILAGLWLFIAAVGVCFFLAEEIKEEKRKEDIQIRTETEPIYNHFPDLPDTSEMQWCSWSSEGIGLTTTAVYIFAFYDHDISSELQEMEIREESEEIELHFIPEEIKENEKWRYVESGGFAFQTDIKSTRKMGTTVYINEDGTILYMEAIGD